MNERPMSLGSAVGTTMPKRSKEKVRRMVDAV